MDKLTRNLLTGMFFCLAGCIGVYLITGPTRTLFVGVAFVILACSTVVGIATRKDT